MTSIITKAALALSVTGMLAAAVPVSAAVSSHASATLHVATGSDAAWENGRGHDRGRHRGWNRGDRYEGRYDDRGYGNRSYYGEPIYANTRTWRGEDGRYYCRRDNGTTGLVIGAAVGGMIGNEMAGRRGDRTLGVILGAAGGALLGREIDRGGSRCR